MKRSILFPYILILLILSKYISAQEINQINGIVRDAANGDTLIGVTIQLKGTHKGTISNAKGNFSLPLTPGDYTLVFSYTGY